jgi:tetratricopeptide (TPR) repeat protein
MICTLRCWIILMTMAQATTTGSLPEFDKLWNYSDPAATEKKFRELLPAAERSGDASYLLQLLTQIARTQGLQDRFAEAHATLDRVEKDLANRNDPLARVRYLLERGRVLNSSGRPAEALPLFIQAETVGREAKLARYEVDAIHMIAIVQSDPPKRIESGLKGIARAKELNQTAWLVALSNNLGEEYRALKQYDKALECFRGVQEAQKQLGRPVDRYARVDEAKMLRLLGQPEQSLDKMRQLEAELKDEQDGFVCEELGEALLATGQSSQAKPYFVTAYAKLKNEEWLGKSEPQRLERLKNLAAGN